MKDTIYRQDAINTLAEMHCKSDEDGYVWIIRSDAWARIDALPSAGPEIIYCSECKYYKAPERTWYGNTKKCTYSALRSTKPYDYCSRAERRTDDNNNIDNQHN